MAHPSPTPQKNPTYIIPWKHPRYGSLSKSKDLTASMQHLTVQGVTAIAYHCHPWFVGYMKNRTIRDDMFFYVTKGIGFMEIEGRRHPLRPGICAHFARGEIHSAGTDGVHSIEAVALHYNATLFGTLTLHQYLGFPDYFDIKGDKILDALFKTACRDFFIKPAGWERGLDALAMGILLHLIREYGNIFSVKNQTSSISNLQRLIPALDAMEKNIATPLFMRELARLTGYSEVQFRRVFARTLRTTPAKYQQQLRMKIASNLLQNTPQTVEAISAQVGYQEPAFFARTFKALVGLSPGAFRRKQSVSI